MRLLELAPRRALLKAFLSKMTLTKGCKIGMQDAMMIVEPSTLIGMMVSAVRNLEVEAAYQVQITRFAVLSAQGTSESKLQSSGNWYTHS